MSATERKWEMVLVQKRGGCFHALIGKEAATHPNSGTIAARKAAAAHLGVQESAVEGDVLSGHTVLVAKREPVAPAARELLLWSVSIAVAVVIVVVAVAGGAR